ncbi:MAG: pentapeptide repeat-containing protein [Mediterraneibacter sp.]
MSGHTDKKRSKLKATVAIIVIFAVAAAVIFLISEEQFSEINKVDDDQRSTLWPLLITLIATMLGSLITSYVFLKEALDRTSDEKTYYSVVIREYREKTMRSLWLYMLTSLALMGIVICLYSMFYFMHIRSRDEVRIILILSYGVCMIGSAWFLNKCIDIDRGLHKTADKLLKIQIAEARELLVTLQQKRDQMLRASSVNESFDELIDRITSGTESTEAWLQIEDETEKSRINKKKFINRFSEWEKILFCLAENGEGFLHRQSMAERVRFAVEHGETVYGDTDVEQNDARAHTWGKNSPYKEVFRIKQALKIDGTGFCDAYYLLSEIRNLLQVQMETAPRKEAEPLKENEVGTLFLFFLMQLSLYVFCMLPKLEVFFPSGKFSFIDFYGIRFETSSFRTSLFDCCLFVRNRMKDCNFGMASFDNCEFYYTSSDDCSFTNTLFESCFFHNAKFENVDFTGAVLENCDLKRAQFEGVVLANVTLTGASLGKNNFSSSRLTDITVTLAQDEDGNREMKECGFASSVLERVKLDLFPEKDYRQVFPRIRTEAKKEKADILKERKCRYGQKDLMMQKTWGKVAKEAVFKMDQCDFTSAELTGIVFYRTCMEQSVFVKTQMDSIKIYACDMHGCIMEQANLRQGRIRASDFRSAVLADAIFYRSRCRLVNFEDSDMNKLHASAARFSLCSFERSDCSRIDLTMARVTESSFQDVILKEAELTRAFFTKVSFVNCIADGMLSSYSTFKDCIFKNAFLGHSSFNYSEFFNCSFAFASFADSTVSGARFDSCDFTETNFNKTCFIGVTFKDSKNLNVDSFIEARFINPVFEGTDESFERALKEKGIEVRRTDAGES